MIFEDLRGKRVLVTGASSGIGAATAIMFAQQGCFVGVHYFATESGAKKTIDEVKKIGDGCLCKGVQTRWSFEPHQVLTSKIAI